jgi:anaerobic selenocysteine-containing dehydrogenase
MCNEFPPHYFNQFRKRFVEARGLSQPDFPNLVKMVLREHHDAMDETVTDFKIKLDDDDRMYFEENEEYNRQAGFKNLITYSRNGISLGLSGADRRYFNFTTFVSNEMLKDNQVEAQKENLKHQLSYRHKADLDPFAPKENIFKLVDPSTRGYGLNKKSKSTDK